MTGAPHLCTWGGNAGASDQSQGTEIIAAQSRKSWEDARGATRCCNTCQTCCHLQGTRCAKLQKQSWARQSSYATARSKVRHKGTLKERTGETSTSAILRVQGPAAAASSALLGL